MWSTNHPAPDLIVPDTTIPVSNSSVGGYYGPTGGESYAPQSSDGPVAFYTAPMPDLSPTNLEDIDRGRGPTTDAPSSHIP